MITVKELKNLIANANDDDVIFFYITEMDRDGYFVNTPAKVKKIETMAVNENERKKYERWGY